jgi:hypothetical protein
MSDAFSETTSSNPFACDAAMGVASSHATVRVVTLSGSGQTCWPLGLCRTPVKMPCLMAPLVPRYDTNATPLLPPGREHENLVALFDAVREDRALPKVIVAQNVIAEGSVWQALLSLHESRTVEMTTLKAWERSILLRSAAADGETYLAQSLSGSTRKRLRAKRRTLENHGSLVLNFHETQEDISSGFAAFLALEASGWKGKSGTALHQHPQDASYVSAVLQSLASLQRAFVATLSTGERIIAAGLFLRSGGEVTFWKTAYDETLAKESPGVIFDTMLTEHFYQQPWFTLLDSASDDTVDPAGLIWKQRRKMARVVVDLNPGSWQGKAIVAGYRLRDGLKTLRNRFRSR